MLELFVAGAHIKLDLPPKIPRHDFLGRERDHRIEAVDLWIEAGCHIQKIHTFDVLAFIGSSGDRHATAEREIERGEALLSIEDEPVWLREI